FNHFYNGKWSDFLKTINWKTSDINDVPYRYGSFGPFKRIFAEFNQPPSKEILTTYETKRYFEDPFYQEDGKYYCFSTQWNGSGDYNLTFDNLRSYFEKEFRG